MDHQPRPIFGRDHELDRVDRALDDLLSGLPQALLVSGDAGIGKTSLARHVVVRAQERGIRTGTGYCLDIATDVALAPVREGIRRLIGTRQDDVLPPITRRLAPALRGISPSDGKVGRVLDDLRLSLVELAAESPVLLVLEDLHWADQATIDFVATLTRSLDGPLMVVLTLRGEEVARGHPLRQVVHDVGRSPAATVLDLEPLARLAIAEVVRATTGDADPRLVEEVTVRSDGNPLYAEELLAGRDRRVPTQLSDLFLDRVSRLSGQTRELLRLASVDGSRIDEPVLCAATGLGEDRVERGLREALDANILAQPDGQLMFRHGLIREALADDLLPRERARAHADLARAIDSVHSDQPTDIGALVRIARHWSQTDDDAEALVWSARAGVAAFRSGTPESTALLEQAADLWERDPDLRDQRAPARAEVLHMLAERRHVEDDNRGAQRAMGSALGLVDEEDAPASACRVYASYGRMPFDVPGHLDRTVALERAIRLASGRPSPELVDVLASKGRMLERDGDLVAAVECSEQAVAVALEVGDRGEECEALFGLGMRQFMSGRPSRAVVTVARAAATADAARLTGRALLFTANQAAFLAYQGRIEEVLELAGPAMERSTDAGLPYMAALNGEQIVDVLRLHGRFDEATELLERIAGLDYPDVRLLSERAELLLARGEVSEALELERPRIGTTFAHATNEAEDLYRQVCVFARAGANDLALSRAELALGRYDGSQSREGLALAAGSGAALLRAALAAHQTLDSDLLRRTQEVVRRATVRLDPDWETTVFYSVALQADATVRLAQGVSSVSAWRRAADVTIRHGAYAVLEPRLGLAEALLSEGDRDEGRVVLTQVWQSAHQMGAGWFEAEALRIARRNRISLEGAGRLPDRLAVLTPREREVLEVLATGATNREIASRLFISEKTASVHVSNLMSKLGVGNRGSAAATARDLGLG